MLWAPSPEMVERSQLTYIAWLAENRDLHFEDYAALWRWSVTEIEEFWRTIWDCFEVLSDIPPDEVLPSASCREPSGSPAHKLNYAEHIFRGKADDEVAVLYASERRELTELRWSELRERVAATREGLRALGVSKGDRVVAYLPNGPEALIAFLASATLGAIWSSCSPTSAPAASSTASPRSSRRSFSPSTVPLRRQGLRPPGHRGRDRQTDPEPRADRGRALPEPVARTRSPGAGRHRHPDDLGPAGRAGRGSELDFERVPFDHPCGSSTPRERPVCRRRSCRVTAGSCSSS